MPSMPSVRSVLAIEPATCHGGRHDHDEASGNDSNNTDTLFDLKSDIASVRSRLGELVVAIFCDLESSIRADAGKQPVRGRAVYPLTRYLMNYLKYVCEYKNTLEQVFWEHHQSDSDDAPGHNVSGENNPFAAQLMEVMELLHENGWTPTWCRSTAEVRRDDSVHVMIWRPTPAPPRARKGTVLIGPRVSISSGPRTHFFFPASGSGRSSKWTVGSWYAWFKRRSCTAFTRFACSSPV